MSKEHFINHDGVVDCLEDDTRILGLFGKYRPLSNFHMEDVRVGGLIFKCSEAAYMAEKTDVDAEIQALTLMSAGDAKRFGQRVTIRSNWDEVKFSAMLEVIRCKFTQCEYLRELLLSTGDKYIEETNWWKDRYWGVCDRVGQNNLGKILMQVREELKTF